MMGNSLRFLKVSGLRKVISQFISKNIEFVPKMCCGNAVIASLALEMNYVEGWAVDLAMKVPYPVEHGWNEIVSNVPIDVTLPKDELVYFGVIRLTHSELIDTFKNIQDLRLPLYRNDEFSRYEEDYREARKKAFELYTETLIKKGDVKNAKEK